MVNFSFFDQQVQQLFYNIQHALITAQAQLSDIAVLRMLIVDHDSEKLQIWGRLRKRNLKHVKPFRVIFSHRLVAHPLVTHAYTTFVV